MEYRLDTIGKIDSLKRTPQGGLDLRANLTRTGIFIYRQPDGTVRREYRPEAEVFKGDSLESLRGAPLTVGHPGLVRPDNWRNVTVGHVADDVKQDGKFVASRVRVQEAGAVKAVEAKALMELSCGYTCDVEMGAGTTPDGEHFDAIQRNIHYNHVSLLPEGGGRAGSDVALRMDGCDSAYASYMPTVEELQKQLDTANGELAGYKTRADAAEKKLAETPAINIDALVTDRLALVQDAKVVLGDEVKFDGVAELDVIKQVCAKAFPEVKLDGKSEDYLRGLFVAGVKTHRDGQAAVASTNVRVDQSDLADKVSQARERNEQRQRDAWKGN